MSEHDPEFELCASCEHERFFHDDSSYQIRGHCGAMVDNGGCNDPEHCSPMTCDCDTFAPSGKWEDS